MIHKKQFFIMAICLCIVFSGCYSEKQPTDPLKTQKASPQDKEAMEMHGKLFAKDPFPSATQCAKCHEQIFNEWRSSAHANAAISPMFHKFEQAVADLVGGTHGSFCVRCHISVGTTLGEPRHMPLWKRNPVSLEGVTCVSCHRVTEQYGRVNGARRMIPGDIHQPIYGNIGGSGVAEVIKNKRDYIVSTKKGEPGPAIHNSAVKFDLLSKSEFCVSCHQVAIYDGIKLEVVWEQYRDSPAKKAGIVCQDCHMGKIPGEAKGYARGPAAVLPNGKVVKPNRKHSNHAFYGPGYSIAHPGIFPHHKDGRKYSIQTWMKFDFRSGWGTDKYEAEIESGKKKANFPTEWQEVDDRYDAREIVDDNLKELDKRREMRIAVMENGSRIDGPYFTSALKAGKKLSFKYKVTNTDSGHNLPSGSLGAQPELWINVALIDPDGINVWESGYIDSYGDMCDQHSLDVAAGKYPHDDQLVNYQTKFLTTNVKGTDREMYLPVNMDVDQRPQIRPGAEPSSVLNHPNFVRMEGRSLPPLSGRYAKYAVPASRMKKKGTYRLSIRMRSRAEPIYFMKFVGATPEMIERMNEEMINIHPYSVEFDVK